MTGLHWYIARRYLRAGRGRGLLSLITWIALGGVTVGVWALVVVIAVMTGMQEDLRNKILESSPHVIVLQQGTTLRLDDWSGVLDSVTDHPDVVGAAPFALSQVSVVRRSEDGSYSQPALLYGVSMDTARVAPPTEMERRIVEGTLNLGTTESGLPPILMGGRLADQMQVFEGDRLVIVALENLRQDVFGGMTPTIREFEVTGTFTTGMWDYDTRNIYTTFDAAAELLGMPEGSAGGIGIRTRDPERANEVASELSDELGYPYYVESWMVTNRALFSALRLEKLAMGLILFLVVLVAAFNIVSTLVMVVADRTREIGILKAMGMTRSGILRVFMMQGAWIGIVGTTLGTVLGVVSAWALGRYEIIKIPPDVYFIDHLPVSLQADDVILIVGASILVAFLATIYPALQASRLEPVEAIRHE